MAQWEAYSWLGLAAASPLACAVIFGCLALARSYRKHWRSVDLLIVAVLATLGLRVILVGAWGVLKLARPQSGVHCKIMIGAMTTIETLQLTALTSLVVDRALTIKWPYRYRMAARRTHVVYHLAVLVVVSTLVGVAGTLALPTHVSGSSFQTCTFLPFQVDVKYSSLIFAVEGGLVALIFIASVYAQVSVCRRRPRRQPAKRSPSDLTSIVHAGASDTSTASTSTSRRSTGGGWAAGAANGGVGADAISAAGLGLPADLRWVTVAVCASCQMILDFGPHLVFAVFGAFWPELIPKSWPYETAFGFAAVLNAFLLPTCLVILDPPMRRAASRTFSKKDRTTGRASPSSGVAAIATAGLMDASDDHAAGGGLSKAVHTLSMASNQKKIDDGLNSGFNLSSRVGKDNHSQSGKLFTNGSLAASASFLSRTPSAALNSASLLANARLDSNGDLASQIKTNWASMEKLNQTTGLKFGTGPDLRSIWVPPPPKNPPPPDLIKDSSSSSSTSGSVLDVEHFHGDFPLRLNRKSQSTTSLAGIHEKSRKNKSKKADSYFTLPEELPSGDGLDDDSSDDGSEASGSDGRCNSFTTDANDDFEFRPAGDASNQTKSSFKSDSSKKTGRRQKFSKSKLDALDEIPPPKEFTNSRHDDDSAVDSDVDGADDRLILRVPARNRRSSASSLAGIDNPIFQPDNYYSSPAENGPAEANPSLVSPDRHASNESHLQLYSDVKFVGAGDRCKQNAPSKKKYFNIISAFSGGRNKSNSAHKSSQDRLDRFSSSLIGDADDAFPSAAAAAAMGGSSSPFSSSSSSSASPAVNAGDRHLRQDERIMNDVSLQVYRVARDHQHQTLQQKWKAASLSMNALDNLSLDCDNGFASTSSQADKASVTADSGGDGSSFRNSRIPTRSRAGRSFFGPSSNIGHKRHYAHGNDSGHFAKDGGRGPGGRSGSSLSLYRVEADENFSPPYMPMNFRPNFVSGTSGKPFSSGGKMMVNGGRVFVPAVGMSSTPSNNASDVTPSPPATSSSRKFGFGAGSGMGGSRGVASLLRRQHQFSPQHENSFVFPSGAQSHHPFLGRSQSHMVLDAPPAGGFTRSGFGFGGHPVGRYGAMPPHHGPGGGPPHPIFAPRGSMMWAMFRPRGNSASVPDVRGVSMTDYP